MLFDVDAPSFITTKNPCAPPINKSDAAAGQQVVPVKL